MSNIEEEIAAGTISLDSIPDSLDSKDEVEAKVNARRYALAIELAPKLLADYHARVGNSLTSLVEIRRRDIPHEVVHDIIA